MLIFTVQTSFFLNKPWNQSTEVFGMVLHDDGDDDDDEDDDDDHDHDHSGDKSSDEKMVMSMSMMILWYDMIR